MQAYVVYPKTPERFGSNTQPMPVEVAFREAEVAFSAGRACEVFRANPTTPGLSPRQMLERHESFITQERLATFTPPTRHPEQED